jgi:streptogramin lyase
MEGVGVSARHRAQTYTTTVYTDRSGNYAFPPLDAGQYRVWAQAVGFETSWTDQQLASGRRAQQNFSLKTTNDVAPQMSGTEWLASLPEATPEDRRGKQLYVAQCSGCHTASFVLQNRFDEKGWGIIIDMMSVGGLNYSQERRDPMMQHYKKDLAAYLARVRGPQDMATPKPRPRPTGEATQVVITEYDLPRPDKPNYLQVHNGTDWSEGTPSRFDGRGPHDVVVDADGIAWIADDTIPERTLARLDPRTGKVTEFKLPDLKNGTAVSTHTLAVDERTNTVWTNNGNDGEFLSINPRTGEFKRWPRQPTIKLRVGGTLDVDPQGNPWAPSGGEGAIKLDVATGQYSEYPAPTRAGTYGIAADGRSNAWYSQPGADRVVVVDSRTGDSKEIIVGPRNAPEATQFDRDAYKNLTAGANVGTPLMKGPRRGGADQGGNYVYFGEFQGNQLLRIDVRDNSVKEYPMPTPFSVPYAVAVDKNHMAWINMINSDHVARFDPATERFTEYQLPTRGTEIRHIGIDNGPNSPEVWICYDRPNKIARLQLRTTALSGTR